MSAFLKKISTSHQIRSQPCCVPYIFIFTYHFIVNFYYPGFDPSYICVSKRFSLTKQKARYKKLMDEMGKNGFKINSGEKDFQERGIHF